MTRGGERLRKVFAGPGCTVAAPVFDPLSTRLAAMRGWDVCKLSGTVWKADAGRLTETQGSVR